ncbi:MAG: hypothetical protein ACRC92_21820 [Peptostreptococcaceae bacterium]
MQIVYYKEAFDSIELLKQFGGAMDFTYEVILNKGTFKTGMIIGGGVLELLNTEEVIKIANETIESIVLEDVLEKDVKKVVFLSVKSA